MHLKAMAHICQWFQFVCEHIQKYFQQFWVKKTIFVFVFLTQLLSRENNQSKGHVTLILTTDK